MILHDALRKVANEYVETGPFSVTHKSVCEISRDRHDYVSGRLYWWKEDGRYIRKDGCPNPANRGGNFDRQRLEDMINGVVALVLAWRTFGDDAYAQKASEFIAVWFIDPVTAMNPNLDFAQNVPGKKSNGIGVIDTYDFYYLINAAELLIERGFMELEPLQNWFARFVSWLSKSKQAKAESRRKNNHGSSYHLQLVCYLNFIGHTRRARFQIWCAKRRIKGQISKAGSQPLESDRSISLYYHFYNLTKLSHLCLMGRRLGVEIFSYKGRMEQAYRFLFPYLDNQESWPLEQIREVDEADIVELIHNGRLLFPDCQHDAYLTNHTNASGFVECVKSVPPPPTLLRKYICYNKRT